MENKKYFLQKPENKTCLALPKIYLASCNKCNLKYVGSTSTEFKIRFRNHKSSMLTNKKTCELAVHFNYTKHEISKISFIVIEKIISQGDVAHIDRLLLTREAYWTAQLCTYPHGLNLDPSSTPGEGRIYIYTK